MNENFLAEAALAALSDLGESRQDWVGAAIEMASAEKDLALANAGEFEEALGRMKQALQKADSTERETLTKRLTLYQEGKPYRETLEADTAEPR